MATSSLHQTFCENIKSRRVELGLRQKDVADRIGVSTPVYNEWETGKKDIGLRSIERICIALEFAFADAFSEPVQSEK